jgi:hypothetical protein
MVWGVVLSDLDGIVMSTGVIRINGRQQMVNEHG